MTTSANSVAAREPESHVSLDTASSPAPYRGALDADASSANAAIPEPGSGAMFDRIAARYDRLNRILSLGVDQRWRRKTAEALALPQRGRVLDVATGTCDLALAVRRSWRDARVLGVDPSLGMLRVGVSKLRATPHGESSGEGSEPREASVPWAHVGGADGQRLPFADNQFDGACIAFGIRNVPDRALGVREMARVVRPGRRVAILELTEPRGLLGPLTRWHVHWLVPRIGALLSGAREYRYLERSIAAFPTPERFAELMSHNGLHVIEVRSLSFGVCHLFVGEVLP